MPSARRRMKESGRSSTTPGTSKREYSGSWICLAVSISSRLSQAKQSELNLSNPAVQSELRNHIYELASHDTKTNLARLCLQTRYDFRALVIESHHIPVLKVNAFLKVFFPLRTKKKMHRSQGCVYDHGTLNILLPRASVVNHDRPEGIDLLRFMKFCTKYRNTTSAFIGARQATWWICGRFLKMRMSSGRNGYVGIGWRGLCWLSAGSILQGCSSIICAL